jgi:hypothetical protein
MGDLTIRWEIIPGHPEQIIYIIDGLVVGNNDAGFEEVIKIVSKSEPNRRVVLKTNNIAGLGGESFESSLPFSARYDEFKNALGAKGLLVDFV